jgi:hypothetical protein
MSDRKLGAVVRIPEDIHARLVTAAAAEQEKLGPYIRSTVGWLAARVLNDWLDANYPAGPDKSPQPPKKGKK